MAGVAFKQAFIGVKNGKDLPSWHIITCVNNIWSKLAGGGLGGHKGQM